MNSTLQYNNSSVLSATTAQLKTERALVLTITSIVSLIILVVIVFGIRQYFKRKKIRRNYQNYLNDKETVNFLFESGSLLELDKKAVSKDEDLGYMSESSSLLSSGSNNLVLKNDLLSFSLHKKGKRKKPNIPIRTSSLRDRTINGGHNLVKKERIVSEIAPRILKVKPLLASDKREKEDDVENRLDWNKVFTFLVNIIEPATWKLFFIELFDNGRHLLVCGKTSNTIIEHVELTHKGAMSGLFFDLFQEWIKLMGTEASPKQIEKALEGRGDNHALSKFKYFMRTPPLIHEHCKLAGSDHHMKENLQSPINNIERLDILGFREDATFRNRQIQCMALRNGSHTQGANNLFESYMFGQSLNFHSMREERYRFATDTEKRTRYENFVPESTYDDESDEPPYKIRKYCVDSNSMSLRRKNKNSRLKLGEMSANHCRELVCWENIGSEFVIDIIKRLLPTDTQELKSEEYYLFLHHTVSVIMKKAGVPERTVLLMLLEDFNDRFERKTKRGHVTCTIDTSQEAIMIGFEEVECLKLYVDHARKRVIRELKESNKDYVESEYLFIGYDGIPIVNESFEDKIVKETESKKKALTCSTLSQESVQMEACRKDLNNHKHMCEENILASEVQDMKMNHVSLEKTNLISVSNYDEPKATEDFSLLDENVNDDRDGEMNDDKDQELNDGKPICKGILKTSEGQDNIKLDDLCLGKEQIVNFSKYDESKSTEEFSLTCEEIDGDNMENKNDKGELYSMKASPTRPSKPGLPTRSPAGQSEKITKSNSKTKLDQIGIEEITVKNKSHEDFILDIEDFLASDK